MRKAGLKLNENARKAVHILSGIVAVLSFVSLIFFSPAGRYFSDKFLHSIDKSQENVQSNTPKEPLVMKRKYTFFLDERMFTSSEKDNVTTILAIDNPEVKMIITPIRGTSFTQLCTDTEQYALPTEDLCQLNVSTIYSAYEVLSDGVITTIYCIDDGTGSSIEIKYSVPENDTEYTEGFNLLLSMFKLL